MFMCRIFFIKNVLSLVFLLPLYHTSFKNMHSFSM